MRSDLPGRVLFLFAHPDDEFACSMWMRRLVRDGEQLSCVYLTDGGFGGQATERRERESLIALGRLGIPATDVRFLGRERGVGDGTLPDVLGPAWDALEEWARAVGPVKRIVVPAWEGGHQDHDAAHLLGLELARRHACPVEQVPLYNGVGLPGPFFRVLHPLASNGLVTAYRADWRERIAAIALCLIYRSQWKTWVGLLPFFALKMVFSGRFPRQAAEPARVAQPPHEGSLLYERRGAYTYGRFRTQAESFIGLNERHKTGATSIAKDA